MMPTNICYTVQTLQGFGYVLNLHKKELELPLHLESLGLLETTGQTPEPPLELFTFACKLSKRLDDCSTIARWIRHFIIQASGLKQNIPHFPFEGLLGLQHQASTICFYDPLLRLY